MSEASIFFQSTKFSTSNRSKPIRVLTRTKSSCSDDRLPIGYLLLDFHPIWRNFYKSLHFFSLPGRKGVDTGETMPYCKLNPQEFWRAQKSRETMIGKVQVTCYVILSRFEETLWSVDKNVRKWTSNRSKPIRVLTPNIPLAQMKVHSQAYNRTEVVFYIGTHPAQEKTELFFLASKRNI